MKGALGKKPEPATTTAPKAGGASATPVAAKGGKGDLRKAAGAVGFAEGSKMLAPSGPAAAPKSPAPAAPSKTATVSNDITDGPYGWKSKFDVTFTEDACLVSVKVKLEAQEGVSEEDVQKVAAQSTKAFGEFFSGKYKLTDATTKKVFPLKASVTFVTTGEHLVVKLRKGEGRDNLSNWFVKSQGIVRAHELGHQLGLKDEYIDAGAPSRKDAAAAGVKTDNSLMGNFWAEGVSTATVKPRHATELAGFIGGGTGGQYTASAVEP